MELTDEELLDKHVSSFVFDSTLVLISFFVHEYYHDVHKGLVNRKNIVMEYVYKKRFFGPPRVFWKFNYVGKNQKIMNEPHYNQNILDLFFFVLTRIKEFTPNRFRIN